MDKREAITKTSKEPAKDKAVNVLAEVKAKATEIAAPLEKEPEKKEEVKVETEAAKEPEKKEAVKEEEVKTAETNEPEKKEAGKRAVAKKTNVKKAALKKEEAKQEIKQEVYIQYADQEVLAMDVLERVKAAYIAEGHRASAIKGIRLYIKPEEGMAYYVINEKAAGSVPLF